MSLNNSQYDAVMRHYDEVRERHRHAQEERISQIYREIPEIRTLDDQVASESVASARRRITGRDSDPESYRLSLIHI